MKFKTIGRHIAVALAPILFATSALGQAAYRIQVDGLACPFCAYGIEKKLGALPGVEGLETHIKDGTVLVIMKDGARLDQASAEKAVSEAGFSLNTFEQIESSSQDAPSGQTK